VNPQNFFGELKRRNGLFAPVSLFIRPHNETLSVAAMRVGNSDRSSPRING
jgi:hypothetical protein